MISDRKHGGRTSTLVTVGDDLDLCVGVVYGGDAHRLMLAGGFKRRGLSSRGHGVVAV